MMRGIFLDNADGAFAARLAEIDEAALPAADVAVRISHSTLNYKDALAITNSAPVVRRWPMVPGIDGAGVVEESSHPDFAPGDRIVHTGWGVGETHWGCLAEKARLKGEWLVPLPTGLSARDAMGIGTAGLTAMLAVMALERHGVSPGRGEILVTGATGGVGSFAVAILAASGYAVVASSGKAAEAPYLGTLGAREVIDRADLTAPGKPLQKERWAGVIDSVGSVTLANACAATRYGGVVAACGLAQGMDFPATVAPFILRGVTLAGVDSVMAPRALRAVAWQRLARELPTATINLIGRDIPLNEAIARAPDLLAGKLRGRLIVDIAQAA